MEVPLLILLVLMAMASDKEFEGEINSEEGNIQRSTAASFCYLAPREFGIVRSITRSTFEAEVIWHVVPARLYL